ncbi:MAG: primosomal protein N' [Clostridia bacterium]|nr:primosomal protein N' [Clostridia bacterium]
MIYEVIVDISNSEVDKVFDYSSSEDYPVGTRVKVPFGKITTEGFIIGKKDSTSVKTRDIIGRQDDFVAITPEMIDLVRFMKEHKNLRLIDTIRLCIPSKLRGNNVRELKKNFITAEADFEIAVSAIKKNAPKQLAVLERLQEGGEYESVLNARFGSSAVKALLDKGLIKKSSVVVRRTPYEGFVIDKKAVTLTEEQQKAKEVIDHNDVTLLHGVTGSGKTEVYMSLISDALSEGKTAIMLVPEINLTPQMLGVFRSRFGEKVAILHSGLSDGERFDEWLRLLSGEAKVALGARSAIFAPCENVGVIIMDEEHDNSYVSESNPRYFTHDVAEFRRKYNNAKLVLGSATPSLESYKKASDGVYALAELPHRVHSNPLPDMEIVDMRKEIRAGNNSMFSRLFLSELDKCIEEGNQAMIFINRRGFASFVRCKVCGYIPKCSDCEVSLTYHKEDDRLKCHYCGKQYHTLSECPNCGNKHLNLGRIGTETVVEELNKLYPDVLVLRMDNDTTAAKNAAADILATFREKKAQILVGTQMIVKGHDFSDVTLVGVLDADLSLYYSDYRSNETTFQLITQVAGRAGRDQKPGKVVIQTYNPHHYVFGFASKYDYKGFYKKESNVRETTSFPPYSKIVRVLVKSENEEKALTAARLCYNGMREIKGKYPGLFRVQAMRAPITKISNEYRFQVVVWLKVEDEEEVLPLLYQTADSVNKRGVVTFVEVNPTQMR